MTAPPPDALVPVLRDARATAAPVPARITVDAGRHPGTLEVMLYGADGSAHGFELDGDRTAVAGVALAADRYQEWAIDELWQSARSTSWPPCPRHATGHPLSAEVAGDRAVWRCDQDAVTVAPIGELS